MPSWYVEPEAFTEEYEEFEELLASLREEEEEEA